MSKAATDTTCRCGCGSTEGIIRHSGRGKVAGYITGHSPKEREQTTKSPEPKHTATFDETTGAWRGSDGEVLTDEQVETLGLQDPAVDRLIERVRADRTAGLTLAELKGKYGWFRRAWVADITPQRSVPAVPWKGATADGPTESARANNGAAGRKAQQPPRHTELAPLVKRTRADHPTWSYQQVAEACGLAYNKQAWRICNDPVYTDIPAADPERVTSGPA